MQNQNLKNVFYKKVHIPDYMCDDQEIIEEQPKQKKVVNVPQVPIIVKSEILHTIKFDKKMWAKNGVMNYMKGDDKYKKCYGTSYEYIIKYEHCNLRLGLDELVDSCKRTEVLNNGITMIYFIY